MDLKGDFLEEKAEISNIFSRIKKRDFSGNTGQAIKNSSYQLATTLLTKIGSLFFTILIARIMAPELYGLYGLALSTILLFGFFSDLGVGTALNTFLSKIIDKDKKKAKAYFCYLTKFKLSFVSLSLLILIMMAKWISTTYYSKPIYYALLAGTIYLLLSLLISYLGSLFTSRNKFKPIFIKELIFQILRLTILPLLAIYLLNKGLGIEMFLFWIFIALSFCFAASLAYTLIALKLSPPFNKESSNSLTKKEKKSLGKFILPLAIVAFSGIFFGYIDQIMLGHKVFGEFIGYYQAGFNLITAAAVVLSFSSSATFPLLARLTKTKLNRAFIKIRNFTFLISFLAMLFSLFIAPYLIQIIYGAPYLPAVLYFRLFTLLLLSFPLISIYQSYYTSQKRTMMPSAVLLISTVLNIILNYFFINFGLGFGMRYAVLGACIATIISQYFYLGGLILFKGR